MASNLRVDNILPSSGTSLGIGTASGTINFLGNSNITTSGDVTIGGNLGVGGTVTYEDVARVDATGLSTFREGFGVGPLTGIALTAYKDGSVRTSGIITASSFTGTVASSNLSGALPALDGSALTGLNPFTGNVGVQTGNITRTDLVGAGSSFVGMYIGDGFLAFNKNLNKSSGYYITTDINALNAGPVTLGSTMTLDGTWVIV